MNSSLFNDLLIILGASVLVNGVFARLRWAPILGYLLIGLLLGPAGFGVLSNAATIQSFSEFGIVFLLFTLGLEFSIPKMLALRRPVFGLGGLQVVICSVVFLGLCQLWDLSWVTSSVIAVTLALSSTAIVTKELMCYNELNRHHGQVAFAILLFQDLAAVVFLLLIPLMNEASQGQIPSLLGWLLFKTLILFAVLLGVGRSILPKLFQEAGKSAGNELFVLTVLVVALLAAWLTHHFGLSMSLGAFLAGMTLGESHYRHQIEADIRPFRDILLGLFFVGVGSMIDGRVFEEQGLLLLAATLVYLSLKFTLIATMSIIMGEGLNNGLRLGSLLSQGGEFGFVLLALAGGKGLLNAEERSFVSAMIILSMLFAPIIIRCGRSLIDAFAQLRQSPLLGAAIDDKQRLAAATVDLTNHVIICGYGRVGQTVSRFLRRFDIEFVALDSDSFRVNEAAGAGENVFFGDSRRPELLLAAGIAEARLLVISFSDDEQRLRTLASVRSLREDLPVLVRTNDDSQLQAYLDKGASEVVPEVLEGSLMLVSHVLAMLNVPIGQIIRSIDQVRRERYQILHGFFLGEHTRLIDEEGRRLQVLHAVPLPEQAYAVGRHVASLKLEAADVELQAIRRGDGSVQAPPPETVLQAGDIAILCGAPEDIEKAEKNLLTGF